ncbi:LysR family transcriptional regulator, partial [Pseudomonas syringae]|uniref:LysR family transcriptional regulator n=1 Tax=Pseudomonas syringae TaxID=317 RepID=UPI0034D73034
MELAQPKMVRAVAQTGSVAQAALQLHCVPSNITTRIKQLESELGTPLFIRAGRGLAISAAGEIFLDYCERILG